MFFVAAYDAYAKATGATFDKDVKLLSIPADKYDNLKSLYFNIGSVSGIVVCHLSCH